MQLGQRTPLTRPHCCATAPHAHQYGALVFHNAIGVTVKINWDDLFHTLHHINHRQTQHDRVLEWCGSSQQRIMLHAVATTVYSWPDKDPDTKIDFASAQLDNWFYITAYL